MDTGHETAITDAGEPALGRQGEPTPGLRRRRTIRDRLAIRQVVSDATKGTSLVPTDGSPMTFGTQVVSINSVICFVMLMSVVLCAGLSFLDELARRPGLLNTMTTSVYDFGWFTVANIALIELSTAAMIMMTAYNSLGKIRYARYVSRMLVFLLLASAASCLMINGMTTILLAYLVQLSCVIAYQISNDPNLTENVPRERTLSWRQKVRSAFASMRFWDRRRGADKKSVGKDEESYRVSYMPLNFFNLFWVFMVGSVVGLVLEDIYHVAVYGEWQSRIGLLWGPFSPIYGMGAVCLTVALNRYWRAPAWKVLLVSGVVGSVVEYITSWYLEKSIGVVAWDYTGTLGNVNGRTNLFFFVIWAILGLVWIRSLLPLTMRVVDAIRLDCRAWLTISVAIFMLVNACMTMLTTDCWSRRHSGHEPETIVEIWCSRNYGDEFMESRFETMSFGDDAVHTQISDSIEKDQHTEGRIGGIRLF